MAEPAAPLRTSGVGDEEGLGRVESDEVSGAGGRLRAAHPTCGTTRAAAVAVARIVVAAAVGPGPLVDGAVADAVEEATTAASGLTASLPRCAVAEAVNRCRLKAPRPPPLLAAPSLDRTITSSSSPSSSSTLAPKSAPTAGGGEHGSRRRGWGALVLVVAAVSAMGAVAGGEMEGLAAVSSLASSRMEGGAAAVGAGGGDAPTSTGSPDSSIDGRGVGLSTTSAAGLPGLWCRRRLLRGSLPSNK